MKRLTVALAVACLTLWVGPIFAQDDPPPVDIYTTSMSDYINKADCNMTMKLYSGAYCEALEDEADRLVHIAIKMTKPSKDLPAIIRKAHAAMKVYAEAMSGACEDVQWWDFDNKEMMWGTGYGYTTMSVQATIYWRHIVAYQEFIQAVEGPELDVTSPLNTDKIGGVAPMMVHQLVNRPKYSKTTQKRIKNHKRLHGQID